MRRRLEKLITSPFVYLILMKIRPYIRRNVILWLCAAAFVVSNIFSFAVISRHKKEAAGLIETYSKLIGMSISNPTSSLELHTVSKRILAGAVKTIIVTDTSWNPVYWCNLSYGSIFTINKKYVPENADAAFRKIIDRKIESFRKSVKPTSIFTAGGNEQPIGYLLHRNSMLITSLYILPFFEIGLAAAFIFLLYLAFHNIRITERSNLWVGLAKETAHQLGTPISSIMGWTEYLRSVLDEGTTDKVGEIRQVLIDINSDLRRLLKITARFSQIGSTPSLGPCDVSNILVDVSSYFKMRLPMLRKRIGIEYDFNKIPLIYANRDLLEWVFENMIKNSIDAITCNEGKINIKTEHLPAEGMVRIQISDNGQGIPWEIQKKIFTPGFSTKRRGWGLGLTLAKRIIEDYHNGEIYVAWTQRDKGTVFNVDLPVYKEKRTVEANDNNVRGGSGV